MNECNTTGGASPHCASTCSRDPLTNAVTTVYNPYLNINAAAIRGIDYELLWNKTTHFFSSKSETLTLRFLAGRLLEDSTTTPSGAETDLAGGVRRAATGGGSSACITRFGASAWVEERYLASSGINAQPGPVTYISSRPASAPKAGQLTVDDATVDPKRYTDLTFSWDHGHEGRQDVAAGTRDHERDDKIHQSSRCSISASARSRIPRDCNLVRRLRPAVSAELHLQVVTHTGAPQRTRSRRLLRVSAQLVERARAPRAASARRRRAIRELLERRALLAAIAGAAGASNFSSACGLAGSSVC